MRSLIFLIISLLSVPLFSQVQKIKIKKQEALYKATLVGVDTGFASLKKILKEKKIKVSNEKDQIKIFSYIAYVTSNEQSADIIFAGKDAELREELLKELQKGAITLRIRNILAYNSFNETIKLNNISITFVK